ncbi:hypothetical protein HY224_02895, partial [Candidatus Uhrbacteria bacterium]|nr:hypothetical protein [Candidatus Uhrbacteria bacterium]
YERKKKEILASHDSIEVAKKRFEELKSKTVVKFAFQTKCEDATGDYLHNCHEVKRMFDSTSAKACAFSADGEEPIDCYDCNNFYYKCELCLDMMGVLTSSRSRYSTYVFNCSEIEYCDNMTNCNSCFGCIGMKKRDYYILNKQYTPEKYRELRKQIVESMKKEGLYGSFLPPSLSPFGYNEVLAKDYFPLTREEALARGFKWQDKTTGTSGKETIKQIPATMAEVDDKILNEVLVCEKCRLNFKITPAELAFYRKMGLPLPHFDFECRHQARLAKRNPRQLWTRQCLCDYSVYKNLAKHDHHPTGRCPNKFETSYAPDKPGIVYCEQCYQAEVV